ncbi:hypothetical protein SAMN02745125_01984, partial [Campylobacter helveticus]
MRTCC